MADAAALSADWWEVDDFIEHERRSEFRHELVGGYLRAMAGATLEHSAVVRAAVIALDAAALRRGCRLHATDTLLRIDDDMFYPDVMIACQPPVDARFEREPCLIIEVLSTSTAEHDRHTKRLRYQAITSLRQYLIVSIDARTVECHTRVADDRWRRQTAEISDSIPVVCLDDELLVADLFARL